jgi:hypothetical protein
VTIIVAGDPNRDRRRGQGRRHRPQDERDAHIYALGDRVAFDASSVLMIGVLAMAMLEWAHVWIANGIFATFVAGSLVSSTVKLAAYRRGF